MRESMHNGDQALPRRTYSVSALAHAARALIETNFPDVWVEGEVSNLAAPASGHLYFTLKDADSQIRCALFRQRHARIGCRPVDGMHVLIRGRVSLYEPRGDFQIIASYVEQAGEGALRRAFEVLKRKLMAEGLFDESHKRPLPPYPRHIGVISSQSGAAVRDIFTTLNRRFPAAQIAFLPVAVQGPEAAREIVDALDFAATRAELDVLILSRGGGSLEDLAAFNDEGVARAMHRSRIPIVAGIGHETDFTIADFVADHRAPTPTAAAELVSPDAGELMAQLRSHRSRLEAAAVRHLRTISQRIDWLYRRLYRSHPQQRLRSHEQRLQTLNREQCLLIATMVNQYRLQVSELTARLAERSPRGQVQGLRLRHKNAARALAHCARATLAQHQYRLNVAETRLRGASPTTILERGYAIIHGGDTGVLIRDAVQVAPGDPVTARLARGEIACRVEKTRTFGDQ